MFFPLLDLSINWNTMYTLSIPEKHIIKCWKLYIPKNNHTLYTLFANVCVTAYFLRFQRFNSDTSLTYRTKRVYFYIEQIFLSGCRSPKPLTQTLVITRIHSNASVKYNMTLLYNVSSYCTGSLFVQPFQTETTV